MRLTLAVTTLAVLLAAACSSGNSTATATPSEPARGSGPPQTVINCLACPLVDVTRVIDGDTIDTSGGRVRFYGIDTPERGEACFSEATAATERLAGSKVRLEDGPRLTDSFNRRLAYVFDASGNSIDVQLVAGGFARAWTQDGQHRDVLVGPERSARSSGAGCLWE
jgi:endonuclease YncB( thermonuclease family)